MNIEYIEKLVKNQSSIIFGPFDSPLTFTDKSIINDIIFYSEKYQGKKICAIVDSTLKFIFRAKPVDCIIYYKSTEISDSFNSYLKVSNKVTKNKFFSEIYKTIESRITKHFKKTTPFFITLHELREAKGVEVVESYNIDSTNQSKKVSEDFDDINYTNENNVSDQKSIKDVFGLKGIFTLEDKKNLKRSINFDGTYKIMKAR